MPGFSVPTDFGLIGDRGRSQINNISGTVNPYTTFMWEVPLLFGDNISADRTTVYLKDATLPNFNVDQELVQGASITYKYASNVIWEDIRISWYDTHSVDGSTSLVSEIKKWRKKVWTSEHGIQAAAGPNHDDGYKRDTILTQYTSDMAGSVKYKLFGSWPKSIRYGDLTYTVSDIKFVEVVISYDYADEDYSDQ